MDIADRNQDSSRNVQQRQPVHYRGKRYYGRQASVLMHISQASRETISRAVFGIRAHTQSSEDALVRVDAP